MSSYTIASASEPSVNSRINELATAGKKASYKTKNFFIIYQSKDINGAPLADEVFAQKLKAELEKEKLTSGKRAVVGIASDMAENTEEVFAEMCASVIILVVLSEAAIKTFAGDIPAQNNFLLHIQFALKLSDSSAARILGLNLTSVEEYENTRYISKFQGWMVPFSDKPHPSPWIQDNISKSMQQLFSIQGINIDRDDWQFKIPTLFASYYAAMDDLNASSWQNIHTIIPWKSISGLLLSFLYAFCLPVIGFLISLLYWRFSKQSERHRAAHLNTALFASGLALIFISTVLAGLAVANAAQGNLCDSSVQCEVMVRSGSRWSLWNDWASTKCVTLCYPNDPGFNWSQVFSEDCAECVCKLVIDPNANIYEHNQKNCTKPDLTLAGLTAFIFVVGMIAVSTSVRRLQKQAYKAFGSAALPKNSNSKHASGKKNILLESEGISNV